MRTLKNLIFVICICCTIFSACSKSTHIDPPVNPPVDSIPGKGTDDSTNKPPTVEFNNVDIEASNFPLLDKDFISKIYLGAIIKKSDINDLSKPVITAIDTKYRNAVTIYTSAIIDSFAQTDKLPSRSNDQSLLNNIIKQKNYQINSISAGSPNEFKNRFNNLRANFAINYDLNKVLDLGFSDTTKLDSTKGRILYGFDIVKTSIVLEPPIYKPFLKIDSTHDNDIWATLLGTGEPQIISQINYGLKTIVVFESDSGTSRLNEAIKNYFQMGADKVADGSAFNSLSSGDKDVINNAKTYGYLFGMNETLTHNTKSALAKIFTELLKLNDPSYVGLPISYNLNSSLKFETYYNKFTLKSYNQKVKE